MLGKNGGPNKAEASSVPWNRGYTCTSWKRFFSNLGGPAPRIRCFWGPFARNCAPKTAPKAQLCHHLAPARVISAIFRGNGPCNPSNVAEIHPNHGQFRHNPHQMAHLSVRNCLNWYQSVVEIPHFPPRNGVFRHELDFFTSNSAKGTSESTE